jgi:16S rRNA (guanine527-N7)-methyltransferase
MDTARIAELLEPFLHATISGPASSLCHSEPAKAGEEPAVLSSAQLHDISTYIDILLRWNARINLTAIRDPEDIVRRHFGESLFAARQLLSSASSASSVSSVVHTSDPVPPVPSVVHSSGPVSSVVRSLHTVADIGSGAGFPGLPMKLWAPRISLTLIESNHKKATFLREVVRALTLTDVNIKNTRAEALSETYNLVTLRAVEHFESILPTAATLVAPGGRLALLIGSSQIADAHTSLPHLSWSTPIPIPLSRTRVLAVAQLRTK